MYTSLYILCMYMQIILAKHIYIIYRDVCMRVCICSPCSGKPLKSLDIRDLLNRIWRWKNKCRNVFQDPFCGVSMVFCEGCIPPEICKARRYRQCHIEWSQSWENETTWGCYTASRLDVGGSQCVSMCEYCTECLCLLATSTPWKLVLHGSSPCQFAIPLMLVCKSLARYVVCIPLPCHKRKHGKCISLQCSMGSTQWVSLEVNCVGCDFFEPAMRDYLSEKVRKQNEQNVATHTDWDLQLCPLDSSCLVSLILDAALGLCVGNFYPCFGSAAQRMSGAQLRDAKCLPSWGASRLSHTPTHIFCSKCVWIIVESFSYLSKFIIEVKL